MTIKITRFVFFFVLCSCGSSVAHGTVCVEGEIFLNSGVNNDNYSLVEMCNGGGKWVSPCDSDWSKADAATACHQAGFDRYGKLFFLVPSGVFSDLCICNLHSPLSLSLLQPAASAKRSLPSGGTAAHVFKCGSTEPTLSQCLVLQPDNITCQHLELTCGQVTASRVPTITDGPRPSLTTSDTSFPIVGVVMGILSALLLVGVVTVIGIVAGTVLWKKKKKSKSVMLEHFPDEPTYVTKMMFNTFIYSTYIHSYAKPICVKREHLMQWMVHLTLCILYFAPCIQICVEVRHLIQ